MKQREHNNGAINFGGSYGWVHGGGRKMGSAKISPFMKLKEPIESSRWGDEENDLFLVWSVKTALGIASRMVVWL